jgi:hypothetical protein
VRLAEAVPQDMIAMPLGQHTRHVVVGAPNYFANRSRPIAPADLIGPRWLPPFSLRTSQRNRNELGETTVNKTWRKIPAAAIKINNLEDIHCVRDAGAQVLICSLQRA